MNLKNIIALAVMICLSSTPVLAKKEKDKNKALPQGLQMKLDRGGSLERFLRSPFITIARWLFL
jgi:hypothetical protein